MTISLIGTLLRGNLRRVTDARRAATESRRAFRPRVMILGGDGAAVEETAPARGEFIEQLKVDVRAWAFAPRRRAA